ncbi:hypothetical protein RHCRD62_80156 [Rhodococcus sp. RD6.2]|nr:hypothetical protein RHCRD62_80156 [Rhodococcus sp. RD6.2]
MVLADGLDRTAVTTGARVRDDDAVLGVADLAEAGELDLDSHGGAFRMVTAQFSDAQGVRTRFCVEGDVVTAARYGTGDGRTAVHSARRGPSGANRPGRPAARLARTPIAHRHVLGLPRIRSTAARRLRLDDTSSTTQRGFDVVVLDTAIATSTDIDTAPATGDNTRAVPQLRRRSPPHPSGAEESRWPSWSCC